MNPSQPEGADSHAASREDPPVPVDLSRYSRQMLFAPIGEEGQRRLARARVLLVGCGALGTHLADALVRAGVGLLRLVDRDFIELNNLQRQVLFDEDDIAAGLPKAEAARRKLARINTAVSVEAVVADATFRNIEQLAEGVDLLLDGTDNFETRYLINDLAVKTGRPWIYGACVGATGLSMPVLPGETPCLRCVFEQAPPPEMNPTCDTAGILGPTVSLVTAHQAMQAIKLLSGHPEAVDRRLLHFDAWQNRCVFLNVQPAQGETDCPCCRQRRFDFLDGTLAGGTTVLCGRNAVQVTPVDAGRLEFAALAPRLTTAGATEVRFNAFMLKARVETFDLTLFPDGRAIIAGTRSPEQARTLYARYIGA
ncbi:MAG TPA: ThiF family adenylyltransferase [Phycisphaerae bacterium]|nr:ThiF family adenylyltransferase [Phycisphaerae bacterium]HOJ72438.1 ThiF family adenylyltransferase [Phycisphaerae bacterium]HOM49900.1 ThiF family adenylyltransferase [Phycisphaerae bacterium]HON67292.1 ThiF family adenylyltransferase [Phycisphaerae bacterium]HPP26328.1 ThiF family adenylyltransferase [Phycisphaerae bacterium]